MAKKKHRGGWPKRERTSFIVRVAPWAADALTACAGDYHMSRNQFLSTWLEGLAVLSMGGPHADEVNELVELFGEMAQALPRDIDGATVKAMPIFKAMRTIAQRAESLKQSGGKS